MNRPLGPYEFSRAELEVLRELARSSASITELAQHIRKSQPTVTAIIKRLQSRGFVIVKRSGMRKLVEFSQTKHAQLFREIMLVYPHVPWQSLLAYSQIHSLLKLEGTAPTALSKTTEWRVMKNLMAHGILSKDERGVRINPRFHKVGEFINEFSSFINSRLAAEFSEAAVIVWASGPQFIIRVPQGTKTADNRFKPTATTALPRYGIRLISNVEYYYFSPKPEMLRCEDVALHTILIDGVTNVTYTLILVAKTKMNRDYMLRRAEKLGLRGQVEAMLRFLDTGGERQSDAILPRWDEFAEKAREYGVDL